MNYTIGAAYRYPNDKKQFVLSEVVNGWIFHFECGHWCTDTVFMDLINISTGIHVYKDQQYKLL